MVGARDKHSYNITRSAEHSALAGVKIVNCIQDMEEIKNCIKDTDKIVNSIKDTDKIVSNIKNKN